MCDKIKGLYRLVMCGKIMAEGVLKNHLEKRHVNGLIRNV